MIKEIAPADLRGHGLRLRTWQPDDVGPLLRGVRDPEYRRWNTHHAPILDEAAAAALLRDRADGWQRGDAASYCVTDETTGAVLGHVGLTAVLPALRTARVGYWILPEARGRGVAGHALELVSRWAFDDIGLHRIELGHAVGHEASCRIALRHAYVYEGTLRGAMPEAWGSGTFQDMHLHARLATDCA
ncbi:GNAT family N-acetyltransferase [Streptomyces sp. ISL-98]|uniref:GNAT family N-acetyltransferase n=1 Tax=Streptomyces sp. ISL-98 TaxID=2819192 RepID=UPI001BE73EAE|nr:GNAT family N-acetyltransferase [Streptomyces sp. ISL-98]MBT2505420.1 GNAT family N-acetyltransferase [Streptomyces sp. ISL-98]